MKKHSRFVSLTFLVPALLSGSALADECPTQAQIQAAVSRLAELKQEYQPRTDQARQQVDQWIRAGCVNSPPPNGCPTRAEAESLLMNVETWSKQFEATHQQEIDQLNAWKAAGCANLTPEQKALIQQEIQKLGINTQEFYDSLRDFLARLYDDLQHIHGR